MKNLELFQMKRASVSILSNIAEGSGRNSDKKFNHFLVLSLGSAFEFETQLILTKKLGLVPNEEVRKLINDLVEIQKMIYSFKQKLVKK